MSPFPENVIRLDDHRSQTAPGILEDEPMPMPRARHLRLVRPDTTVFRLDVFLARAAVVMAEADEPAAILPLHRRPA